MTPQPQTADTLPESLNRHSPRHPLLAYSRCKSGQVCWQLTSGGGGVGRELVSQAERPTQWPTCQIPAAWPPTTHVIHAARQGEGHGGPAERGMLPGVHMVLFPPAAHVTRGRAGLASWAPPDSGGAQGRGGGQQGGLTAGGLGSSPGPMCPPTPDCLPAVCR